MKKVVTIDYSYIKTSYYDDEDRLHRVDSPALIKKYHSYDVYEYDHIGLHKEEEVSKLSLYTKGWYIHGELHCEVGPAFATSLLEPGEPGWMPPSYKEDGLILTWALFGMPLSLIDFNRYLPQVKESESLPYFFRKQIFMSLITSK